MSKLIKRVAEGNALAGALEFYTVTGVDLTESEEIWNTVVEVIQATTNVVVLSAVNAEGFTFATEREGAANVTVIEEAIQALGSVVDATQDPAVTIDLSTAVVAAVELDLHSA